MGYIEESLQFIESAEIREHLLHEHYDGFNEDYGRLKCVEIVSGAPAPIEKKIPVLDLIAEHMDSNPYPEWNRKEPAKLAEQYRIALRERYENSPPGTVFLLMEWDYNKLDLHEGRILFSEFDAAIRHIKEYADYCDRETGFFSGLSYSIDKCIPGKNGEMDECCRWILNATGEIWYFEYSESFYGWDIDGEEINGKCFKPKEWIDLYNPSGCNLDLYMPFQVGDIILADCTPFARTRLLVVTERWDFTHLYCLYVDKNKIVQDSAFVHNFCVEHAHFSVLYRAARYKDELPDSDKPLAVIGAAIKENPIIIERMQQFVDISGWRDNDDENDPEGVTWEQLKNEFGLEDQNNKT